MIWRPGLPRRVSRKPCRPRCAPRRSTASAGPRCCPSTSFRCRASTRERCSSRCTRPAWGRGTPTCGPAGCPGAARVSLSYSAPTAPAEWPRPARGSATGLTALQGIDDALHVSKGEAVIVHGASGGVGTLAVQFAKLRGARVLGTASGPDGAALVRGLGADAAVDGKHDDIRAAARRFAPEGVDAVLGLVGGRTLERCLDALRRGGRVAYPNGVEPEPKKRRGIEITAYDAVAGVREFERCNRAVEASRLEVPLGGGVRPGRRGEGARAPRRGAPPGEDRPPDPLTHVLCGGLWRSRRIEPGPPMA
jgi:threonine dehydrogenase-like Zn-dependent dehydrogenase